MGRVVLRAVGLAAFLALASIPVPGAAQQAPFLSDGADDLAAEAGGAPLPQAVPGSVHPAVDLRSLAIAETRSTIAFTIGVAGLRPGGQDPNADGSGYEIFLAHAGTEFRVSLRHTVPALADAWSWALAVRGPDGWERLDVSFEGVVADPAAATIGLAIDRGLLADRDGAAPFPGRALAAVHVESLSGAGAIRLLGDGPAAPVVLRDRMPDDGAADYPVQVGVVQSGDARLRSATPFRASNGEATTFAFGVEAVNLGAAADTYDLAVSGKDPLVSVALPQPVVEVPAGGAANVTVLATVPFAHDHGETAGFTLELRSRSDPGSVGRLEMGVRYLAVPQPAGHHDELVLHSAGGTDPVSSAGDALPGTVGNDAWMNTLAEDPSDDGSPVPPASTVSIVAGTSWTWEIPLSPGLQMGLDGDLARLGRLSVPIGSTAPLPGATLSASVVVARPGDDGADEVVLAAMGATEAATVGPNGVTTFAGDLVPDPAGDRVPFQAGLNLWLRLVLEAPATNVGLPGPYVAPGGRMALPLLEYHDDVAALAAGAVAAPEGLGPAAPAEAKESPGAEAAAAALATGLAALAARRRRT